MHRSRIALAAPGLPSKRSYALESTIATSPLLWRRSSASRKISQYRKSRCTRMRLERRRRPGPPYATCVTPVAVEGATSSLSRH